MIEKKGRKAFWHNFKFKYKLTVINENTLEEVVGLHVSKLNGLSVFLLFCAVIFFIAAIIIVFTPLRNYLPGYMNSEIRSQVVANALRADSLQAALERQNHYIMNIRDILSGQIKADTVQSIDSLTSIREEELMTRSKEEEEFVKQYEERERYNLTTVISEGIADLILYRPVRGVVSVHFNPEERHYGVDISTSPNENILSVLEGTVVFAGYTPQWGYVIQIQHSQNLLSVYRHCGSLIKQEGDLVKGGESIALIRSEEDKPHLHFELWHKGNAVNPEQYVVF